MKAIAPGAQTRRPWRAGGRQPPESSAGAGFAWRRERTGRFVCAVRTNGQIRSSSSPGQSITILARRPFLLLSAQLETQLVFRKVGPCQPEEFVLTCAKVFRAEVEDVPAQPGVISEKIPRVRIPGILQRNGRPRAVCIDAHQM